MQSGFASVKDVLDVIVIPITVVLLGLFWPAIQAQYRCGRFKRLARRELEEVAPKPVEKKDQTCWKDHLRKEFIHRQIVQDPSQHRDFLLGLDSTFVYWLAQLWSAFENDDPGEWFKYLHHLSTHRYTRSDELQKAVGMWRTLLKDGYGVALPAGN